MADVQVQSVGSHQYEVTVSDRGTVTRHTVSVPERLLADLALTEEREPHLVRESFEYLLEREPPTSILSTFSLDVISRYFPDYVRDIRTRVGG